MYTVAAFTRAAPYDTRGLMRHHAIKLLTFFITALCVSAANLTTSMIATVRTSGCARPASVNTLLPGDPIAYVFFAVSGAAVNDQPKVEVYGPSGELLRTSNFSRMTQAGAFCFWDTNELSGSLFAGKLGRYKVKGYWNDDNIFTLNFWIQNPGLTMDQKMFDFQVVASLYAKRYAPYEWKKQLFQYDALNLQPWLEKVSATQDDMGYLDLLVQYVAALNDTHCTYRIPATLSADLGLRVDLYWDENHTKSAVLIDQINRSLLSATTYPFQVGDELVSVDGTPSAELIEQYKKYISAASVDSAVRRAASYLTLRRQSELPKLYQLGNTATVEIKRQSGTLEKYSIPWSFSGTPMRRVGPVQMPHISLRSSDAPSEDPPYMRTMMRFRNERDDNPGEILNYGVVSPVWALPATFTQRLGKASTDNYFSGVFQDGERRIGFLRLPHFSPSSSAVALRQLDTEIAYFQENTDGLVVDVMRNTGGDPCYGEDVLRRLMPNNWTALGRTIRPVWEDIGGFQTDILLAQALAAPKATIDLLQARLNDVIDAYNSERGVTAAVATCAANLERTPAATVYKKPIVLLTDEFSTSAADGFSAQFQDNKRGILFGWRTNGAGGGVINEYPGYYIEGGTSRVVVSMHYRPNARTVKGYPATHYVENVGVHPDIEWNYMRTDNLLQAGKLFVDAFLSVISKEIAAAPK